MIKIFKFVATSGGIGYIGKGGGTVAAAAYCLICYFTPAIDNACLWQVFLLIFITLTGVYSAGKLEIEWGHDSSKVVIDEVAGMALTMLCIPFSWKYLLTGLVLFRFFDIRKPLFIKKTESLPGGWGVMADDILAGVYARVILGIIVSTKLL